MKIEIGESLMLSYLKHVKKCIFYQTNWKVSNNWKISSEAFDKVKSIYDKIIKHSEFADIFKKSELNQLLRQAEIDVIGIDSNNTIYTIDIAFHEAGLNYGDKIETKNRVLKKLLRSYLALLAYFPNKKHVLLFVSPKVNNAIEKIIKASFNILNSLFSNENTKFYYKSNELFGKEILFPTIEAVKLDSDTNELFIRAIKLLELFDLTVSKTSELIINTDLIETDHQETIIIKGISVPLYKEEGEKTQDFVKKVLRLLFKNNLIPEDEIKNMLDEDYCRDTFGIYFPILQYDKTNLTDEKGHPRYWVNKVIENKFYVCSQWWKPNEKIYSKKISEWIKKIGKINEKHWH